MSRRKAEAFLLKYVDQIAPDSGNAEIWKNRLKEMDDEAFEQFIIRLEEGEEIISLFVPNLSEAGLSVKRNLEIAEELGHNFFQHLYLTDKDTGLVYKTPIPHIVVDLPIRRQVQMLAKESAIPGNVVDVDERSGQPASHEAGARFSYPELQVNQAKGLNASIIELIRFRGGDERSHQAMLRQISQTGEAELEPIQEALPSDVKSTEVLMTYLKAMHLSPHQGTDQ